MARRSSGPGIGFRRQPRRARPVLLLIRWRAVNIEFIGRAGRPERRADMAHEIGLSIEQAIEISQYGKVDFSVRADGSTSVTLHCQARYRVDSIAEGCLCAHLEGARTARWRNEARRSVERAILAGLVPRNVRDRACGMRSHRPEAPFGAHARRSLLGDDQEVAHEGSGARSRVRRASHPHFFTRPANGSFFGHLASELAEGRSARAHLSVDYPGLAHREKGEQADHRREVVEGATRICMSSLQVTQYWRVSYAEPEARQSRVARP